MNTPIPISPEAKALLEQLLRERDMAGQRLDIAILSIKAALGVPVEWTIRNLDEGFMEAENNGGNN